MRIAAGKLGFYHVFYASNLRPFQKKKITSQKCILSHRLNAK